MSIQQNINQTINQLGMLGGISARVNQESPEYKEKIEGARLKEQHEKDISRIKDLANELNYNSSRGEEIKPRSKLAKDILEKEYSDIMTRIYGTRNNPLYDKYIKDVDSDIEKEGDYISLAIPSIRTTEDVLKERAIQLREKYKANIQKSINKAANEPTNKAANSLKDSMDSKLDQNERFSELQKAILRGTPSERLLREERNGK